MASTQFGGSFNALAFAYGVIPSNPSSGQVISGPVATGSASVTLAFGYVTTFDGIKYSPYNTNAPILIGEGSASETVTPSAVSNSSPDAFGTCIITATFAQLHGIGDQVRSGTVGLQEAINYVAGYGGGNVIVDAKWTSFGGTNAMLAAAVVPPSVSIIDERSGGIVFAGNAPSSVTALAAPTALTTATSANGMITTAVTGGTIPTASTYRLAATYVDIFGGETTISIDTASTATILTGAGSTNSITVTSPAALAGAVGWKLYMSAASGAAASEILYPVGNAAITGTASASSGIPSFAIGSPVTINAIITGTATVPTVSDAYAAATLSSPNPPVGSYPPFASLASIAAAATGTLGTVNFPAGFFNSIGRTVRFKGMGYATTNATPGTLTLANTLASIPGVTSITPFTSVSGTTTASAVVNFVFDILYVTAAVGATGTLEVHGTVAWNLAGTAVTTGSQDSIHAVSSAIDLTKQDQLAVTLLCTTTATTTTQLRQLTIEVLQ